MIPILTGNKPLISLSVPVYGTESSLPALLDSILEQQPLPESTVREGASFLTEEASLRSLRSSRLNKKDKTSNHAGHLPMEVLIVNDGSPHGSTLPKILKPYKKKFKALGIPLTLSEHSKNLGLVEARRTAVEAASGTYLCFADSDDTLPPKALQNLYEAALSSGADIVHGKAEYKAAFSEKEAQLYKKDSLAETEEKIKRVYSGRLKKDELFNSFLIKGEFSSFLWGKLFRTETVKAAFADIPHTFCTMGEDFLIYFFILLHARSYFGIENSVYTYHIGTGISSGQEIKDLARWERACTAASVFAIVFSYLKEHPFNSPDKNELMDALENRCKNHLASNIRHFERVIPSLRDQAYKILCDYWGEDYVKQVENAINNG